MSDYLRQKSFVRRKFNIGAKASGSRSIKYYKKPFRFSYAEYYDVTWLIGNYDISVINNFGPVT